MTETNDYEKAKQECRNECFDDFLKITGWSKDRVPDDADYVFQFLFDVIFDRAYQLGKAHSQLANGLANERLQVATAAMQGILSNSTFARALGYQSVEADDEEFLYKTTAEGAVHFADALITELNKEKP